MSINFGLAKEIYGATAWAVDSRTFGSYLKMVQDWRNGVVLSTPEEKYNSCFILNAKSGVKTVSRVWEPKYETESDLVYIINLNGPITKNGGDSTFGTKDLANNIKYFESFDNVIGGIILGDSGGGSSNAVEIFDSAVSERTKPIVTLLEKGSTAASACYGCISGSDYIMSDGKSNLVGSIGTMCDFEAIPHGNVNQDGVKTIRIYATKSTAKNKWYEEAVNNDNFEPLISDVLDPANEEFIKRIQKNRPQVLESQLDGSDYKTGKVVGSLIDGFGTMKDAINKVISLSKDYKNPTAKPKEKTEEKKSNSLNKLNMDKEQLKADHPKLYQEVYGEGIKAGIAAEKDRTGPWLAHANTDLPAVLKGIESGGEITATARENFLVKASTQKKKQDLKSDSAPDLDVEESNGLENEKTEADLFYAKVLKEVS